VSVLIHKVGAGYKQVSKKKKKEGVSE